MRTERAGNTLQTTALINEAYLRLVDAQNVGWRAGLLEAIVLNEDDGWALALLEMPNHSQVPQPTIQSDSAVKETDRRATRGARE
jgi:hypothetical protein